MNNNNKKEGVLKKVALAPVKLLNWTAKPVYMPVVNQVKESKERLKPLVEFYDPRNVKKIKENSRVETYEQAKLRRGVSEADLDRNYRNFVIISYISIIVSIVSLGFLPYNILLGRYLPSCAWFFVFCWFGANSFKYSFRAYQIRFRKLCSCSEFLNDKENWISPFRR